ncbi:MAG: ABC transporter ATP-binding protein [Salibacteraceae bacterium]
MIRRNKSKAAKVTKEAFREFLSIFRFLRPYRWAYFLGTLFLVLSSGATLAFPTIMGQLMDVTDQQVLNQNALLLMVIFLANAVFSFFRVYLFDYGAQHGLADIRKTAYAHMVRLPMHFFATRRIGELNSRIAADVSVLQTTFTVNLAELGRQIATIIGGIVLISLISGKLTLFMLAVVPVIMVAAVVFGWFIRRLSSNTQDLLADTNTIVDETLQSIASVKSFTNELFETGRYQEKMQEVVRVALKGSRFRALFISFVVFAGFGGIVLVVWYGLMLKNAGELSFGDLTSFILYTGFLGGAIAGLANLYTEVSKAVGATETLLDILKEPTDDLPATAAELAPALVLKGQIEFRNLSFYYPSRTDIEVLKGIHLNILPGERVALVGPSGSGKSTLSNLLLRFYDPTGGQLLVDGKAINEYDLHRYREHIAIVPQEVLLFGGTIRENIGYGKQGASEEEIVAAAEKANAMEFIKDFPEGFDTVVGERGVQLSGGQRQRIAIARAVLNDPTILILDEATSSLDSESEKHVQIALDQVMEGRTSLVIAHRLSTIRNADKIVVLEKGLIRESGKHEELMAREDGLYQKLSQLQLEQA